MHNFIGEPKDLFTTEDQFWMAKALALASEAQIRNEVPVGALLVNDEGQILGAGFNQRESLNTPLAHAEMLALHRAGRKLKSWRLPGTTLYVTLEPCLMCAGLIIQARVREVIYASPDPKGGAIESVFQVFKNNQLNHQVKWKSGLMAVESRQLLQNFFKEKRLAKKNSRLRSDK